MQYEIPASDTCQQHIFQQKHKMLNESSGEYYKYAVGGKTGYTPDALNTLITMADKDGMQLVCVVLHTQSGHHYGDTRKLFDYGYKNFTKTPVEGNETSQDVGEILEEEGGGYVLLPKGVEFADLEMELVPDDANDGKATLNYTYEGTLVGKARAKLSDQYIYEHKAKIQKLDASDAGKDESKKGMAEKAVLAGLCVVWVILVILFVRTILKRKRRRKQHRRH